MTTAANVLVTTITWSGCELVYPADEGPPDEQTTAADAAHLDATRYSIHFHVWTQADLLELMLHCQTWLGSFDIEAVRRSGLENIVVLRKHGELVIEDSQAGVVSPIGTRLTELERELTEAREDAETARAEARALAERVKTGQQVLADVFNLASWRLTKPLRMAKHAFAGRSRSRKAR